MALKGLFSPDLSYQKNMQVRFTVRCHNHGTAFCSYDPSYKQEKSYQVGHIFQSYFKVLKFVGVAGICLHTLCVWDKNRGRREG